MNMLVHMLSEKSQTKFVDLFWGTGLFSYLFYENSLEKKKRNNESVTQWNKKDKIFMYQSSENSSNFGQYSFLIATCLECEWF